jgi:tellurite resistance protein TehA-like permease
MEKKDLTWIMLISVILVVILSLSIPALQKAVLPDTPEKIPPPQTGPEGKPDRSQPLQGQEENKHLKTAISFINLGLIIPLFLIYAGIYRRMRSSFTLGLAAVIFALGMYAVTSNPLLVGLLGGRTGEIGIFQIIPDLCTTVALVILVRISLE